jgi:hypothetical protein
MPTPVLIQFPSALDDAVSLIECLNNASSPLTAPISVGDLLIPVAQPGKFSNSGIATLVDDLTTPPKRLPSWPFLLNSKNSPATRSRIRDGLSFRQAHRA